MVTVKLVWNTMYWHCHDTYVVPYRSVCSHSLQDG